MLLYMLKTAPIQAYPSDFAMGDGYIDILAAPFGGPLGGKDIHGAYFSENTDFLEDMIPTPGLFYWHGKMTQQPLYRYGDIVYRCKNEDGVWFRVKLDLATDLGMRLWDAAKTNRCFASTGVVPASYSKDGDTGEIKSWLIGDLTLIDEDPKQGRIPANYYAVAKPALKNLMLTVVPEDKRELFQDVFLTESDVEGDEVIEEVEEENMKQDLMKLRAYLAAATDLIATLAAGMDGEDDMPEVSDVLSKCAECQGKTLDEQAKTALLEMNKTVLGLKADIAARDHAAWVAQQIDAGKVQPVEKEELLKTLATAHMSGTGELVKSVMSMVEARNPSHTNVQAGDNLRIAGFNGGSKDATVDEEYMARLMTYAGVAKGGK